MSWWRIEGGCPRHQAHMLYKETVTSGQEQQASYQDEPGDHLRSNEGHKEAGENILSATNSEFLVKKMQRLDLEVGISCLHPCITSFCVWRTPPYKTIRSNKIIMFSLIYKHATQRALQHRHDHQHNAFCNLLSDTLTGLSARAVHWRACNLASPVWDSCFCTVQGCFHTS